MIHGALGNSSAPEFIEFAIPDENNQEWLDKFPVNKLIEMLHNTAPEGKNHQIKKMFESLGYKVIKLRREKIAFLDLKGLMPGEYRNLSIKEVKVLYSLCKK